mgnify:CR=1 FL=1
MHELWLEGLRALKKDPVLFARLLGFKPFPYQERLLKDPSKRIVACWGRQTGKSTTAALKALHFAFTGSGRTVLIISPSLRQSELMFEKIRALIEAEVELGPGERARPLEDSVESLSRKRLVLTNASKVIPLPCSPERVRGFSAHMVVIDEASFVPEELITSVVMPMLAATDGRIIMLGTPWSRDHIFYRAFSGQLPGWSVHHVPSTECPLIRPDFLEEQKMTMPEADFRREYLAEFVEEGVLYFPSSLVLSCIEPELRLASDPGALSSSEGLIYMGLDLGKLRDQSVLAAVEKRSSGVIGLLFLRAFDVGTPYSRVVAEVARAFRLAGAVKLVIDRSGVGEAIFERLSSELGEGALLGFRFTADSKAELLSNLKLLMEAGRLRLPYHRPLLSQLTSITCELTSSGRLRIEHPPRGHDDMVMALALACWGAERAVPGAAIGLWGRADKRRSVWKRHA